MQHNESKESRFDYAVNSIEKLVREGGYAPGDKLPSTKDLCEELNISRTIIREALRVVESHGLISIQAGRGTYVKEYEFEGLGNHVGALVETGKIEVQDLIQARHFLEPGIAHIAALRATERDVEKLTEYLKIMADNLDAGDAFMRADQDFHLTLAKATNNPILYMMGKTLVDCLIVFRKTIYEVEGAPAKAVQRHSDILAAVKAHEAQIAYQAMEDHIIDAEEHQRVRMMQESLSQLNLQ